MVIQLRRVLLSSSNANNYPIDPAPGTSPGYPPATSTPRLTHSYLLGIIDLALNEVALSSASMFLRSFSFFSLDRLSKLTGIGLALSSGLWPWKSRFKYVLSLIPASLTQLLRC